LPLPLPLPFLDEDALLFELFDADLLELFVEAIEKDRDRLEPLLLFAFVDRLLFEELRDVAGVLG